MTRPIYCRTSGMLINECKCLRCRLAEAGSRCSQQQRRTIAAQ